MVIFIFYLYVMIFELSKTNSIANIFIAEIRDEHIQKDAMRFRTNMERIGEFFAFEISKTLEYEQSETQTPLGIARTAKLAAQPVLATITRAGIPMHKGMLNIFDHAEYALNKAAAEKHESIMIGDSLEADIRGAQDYGIKAIYFNPLNKEKPHDVEWQITNLEELLIHF